MLVKILIITGRLIHQCRKNIWWPFLRIISSKVIAWWSWTYWQFHSSTVSRDYWTSFLDLRKRYQLVPGIAVWTLSYAMPARQLYTSPIRNAVVGRSHESWYRRGLARIRWPCLWKRVIRLVCARKLNPRRYVALTFTSSHSPHPSFRPWRLRFTRDFQSLESIVWSACSASAVAIGVDPVCVKFDVGLHVWSLCETGKVEDAWILQPSVVNQRVHNSRMRLFLRMREK